MFTRRLQVVFLLTFSLSSLVFALAPMATNHYSVVIGLGLSGSFLGFVISFWILIKGNIEKNTLWFFLMLFFLNGLVSADFVFRLFFPAVRLMYL